MKIRTYAEYLKTYCIAYEQHCNLSDVLDVVLDPVDWETIAKNARDKPLQRAAERGGSYQV
jgi:hypothetical protein